MLMWDIDIIEPELAEELANQEVELIEFEAETLRNPNKWSEFSA